MTATQISGMRTNDLQPSAKEIAEGLKRDEFEPFFQPKVALKTGRLNGAEALARWRHPEMGPIEPRAFIKCMEANNQIEALTLTMLRKSAAACLRWLSDGLDVTVSVNLSAVSLVDATFADRLASVVAAEWLNPRHVILEITESAAATDMGMALENLSRLRMRGFGLSIDDYGTGYSSMQQLSRIAFTELKIDQSFIQNVSADGPGRIILESSLKMARRLNLCAVAEGVETREDLDLIRELGCDYAQGFFIARPMETERFGPWARKWQERTVSI